MSVFCPALAARMGERLREIRRSQGITVSALADAMLTTERAIYKVEGGYVGMTVARLYEYAQALGVSPAELLPDMRQEPSRMATVKNGGIHT